MKSLKQRIRQRIFERIYEWRLQEFVRPHFLMLLEYWPELESRYGEGKPAHPEIAALLAARDAAFRMEPRPCFDSVRRWPRCPNSSLPTR